MSADEAFTHGKRQYPAGTAFIRLADIPQNTPAALAQIAQRHGAELVPISETWTESGISLGSGRVASLKAPRVLLAWDAPASSLSAGWARFALERRFGQRVTAMRTSTLQNFNMADYDVLVLPSGTYTFSEDALRRLRDWIRNGGTLITLAEASRWAARDRVGLLSTDTLLRDGSPERDPEAHAGRAGHRAGQRRRRRIRREAGYVEAVRLRQGHSTGARTARESRRRDAPRPARSQSLADRGPRRRDHGRWSKARACSRRSSSMPAATSACYDGRSPGRGRPGLEGSAAAARAARLPDAPADGSGHIIAFAEDPNYRAFTDATHCCSSTRSCSRQAIDTEVTTT